MTMAGILIVSGVAPGLGWPEAYQRALKTPSCLMWLSMLTRLCRLIIRPRATLAGLLPLHLPQVAPSKAELNSGP